MIEFKQIIGRGTRLFDGKDFFTIYDFLKAYERFNDPEWDGDPPDPEPPPPPRLPTGEDPPPREPPEDPRPQGRVKIRVADGKERLIQSMTATSFWGPDGRSLSSAQFIEKLFGTLQPALFQDEDELRQLWSLPDTRRALLTSLSEQGFGAEQLREISAMISAEKSDLFDVLAYIAFALAPITREERVDKHRSAIHSEYDEKLRLFLDFVLAQYVSQGVDELDSGKLSRLIGLKYGTVMDAQAQLGALAGIRAAFVGFQRHLYER